TRVQAYVSLPQRTYSARASVDQRRDAPPVAAGNDCALVCQTPRQRGRPTSHGRDREYPGPVQRGRQTEFAQCGSDCCAPEFGTGRGTCSISDQPEPEP